MCGKQYKIMDMSRLDLAKHFEFENNLLRASLAPETTYIPSVRYEDGGTERRDFKENKVNKHITSELSRNKYSFSEMCLYIHTHFRNKSRISERT